MKRRTIVAEPLTAEQRQSYQELIDVTNERMCAAKRDALDAYARVHPVGHRRCSDACRDAHRELLAGFAEANAEYQAALWGGH